jgi:hypothetical protein
MPIPLVIWGVALTAGEVATLLGVARAGLLQDEPAYQQRPSHRPCCASYDRLEPLGSARLRQWAQRAAR